MSQQVSSIYDHLAGFESLLSGWRKQKTTWPIHKKLNFQQQESTKHLQDIGDWMLEHLSFPPAGKILDAGCGVGNTLLTFCRRTQMSGLGISLSETEIIKAQKAARHFGLTERCRFERQSYADPLPDNYDVVIAIESLKHAPDLSRALNNLLAHLPAGGQLVIVEDFAVDNWTGDQHPLRRAFLEAWSVPDFYTLDDYTGRIKRSCPNAVFETQDFTSFIAQKPAEQMLARYRRLERLKPLVLLPYFKNLLTIFAGGFLLDYFYAVGRVRYQLLLVKPG